MPQNAQIIRVFIASPGDVQEERECVRQTVTDWNATHSKSMGISLEAVSWETHSFPAQGRPQGVLNEQLGDCDILVGIFWARFGSSTGVAESGTAEEITEYLKKGKPVLLYFSSKPLVEGKYNPDQYAKVEVFKQEWSSKGLYSSFASIADFEKQLKRHLHQHVVDIKVKVSGQAEPNPKSQTQIGDANSINIQSGRDTNIQ